MKQRIAHIALVVKDYDEAVKFYIEKLGFNLIEDTKLSEEKHWVIIAPPGSGRVLPPARESRERKAGGQHWKSNRRQSFSVPLYG